MCHVYSTDFIAVSAQTKTSADHDETTVMLLKLQTKEDSNGVTEIIVHNPNIDIERDRPDVTGNLWALLST